MKGIAAKTLADTEEVYQVDLFDEEDEEEPAAIVAKRPGFIEAEFCMAVPDGTNYSVKCPNGKVTLERDVDFGVIPGVKAPSLFKAGAEKIACAFGLLQHYTVENAVEDFGEVSPLCFYRVRCDLTKIGPEGKLYVIATGYGSANTRERRNGRNSIFDAANATLKMATKRSLVAAALSVSSLSGLFSQDLENENFVNANYANLAQTNNADAHLTTKQMRLIYALAGNVGLNAQEAKAKMQSAGYPSMKELTQKDFDKVRELFAPKED